MGSGRAITVQLHAWRVSAASCSIPLRDPALLRSTPCAPAPARTIRNI